MDCHTDGDPKHLRKLAERALRLASSQPDPSAHDALTFYGRALLAQAEKIEAEANNSD